MHRYLILYGILCPRGGDLTFCITRVNDGGLSFHDQSAARLEMNVRGIFDFEHIGTQNEKNAEQNKREARLGCCHAYKLFDGIKIDLKEEVKKQGKSYPESFLDYNIQCDWATEPLPAGVKLHLRHEGKTIPANNGK